MIQLLHNSNTETDKDKSFRNDWNQYEEQFMWKLFTNIVGLHIDERVLNKS